MTVMGLDYLKHLETNRSNLAKEAENYRSNVAKERETIRTNKANELIRQQANDLKALTPVLNYLEDADAQQYALKLATEFAKSTGAIDNSALNSMLPMIDTTNAQKYQKGRDAIDRSLYFTDRVSDQLSSLLRPIDELADTAEKVIDIINPFD